MMYCHLHILNTALAMWAFSVKCRLVFGASSTVTEVFMRAFPAAQSCAVKNKVSQRWSFLVKSSIEL